MSHALKLFQAGYEELVCVTKPGEPIHPKSRLVPESMGKAPGVWRDGAWMGYAFQRAPLPDMDAVQTWDAVDANVGLQGEYYPGLDIDSDSKSLTEFILAEARKHLGVNGVTPIRTSRGHRRLIPFHAVMPVRKMVLEIQGGHAVEWIGTGFQWVAYGTHPSGTQYQWENTDLAEFPQERIPLVGPDMAESFLHHLADVLQQKGIEARIRGLHEVQPPEQESLLAPSLVDLARAVAEIENLEETTREEYINLGIAIKAAGGSYELWRDWARSWPGGENSDEVLERDWESFQPPYRIGWDYILSKSDPMILAETVFEADPDLDEDTEVRNPIFQGAVPLSEEEVARLLAPEVVNKVRFDSAQQLWLSWDGTRWVVDNGLAAEMVIRDHLRAFAGEVWEMAMNSSDKDERKTLIGVAKRSQSATGIRNILSLMRGILQLDITAFDKDPMKLNTPKGLVDLRTGELQEPHPELMVSKQTLVAPASGEHPYWDRFLDTSTGGDPEMIEYIQRLCGYILTGKMDEKSLWFLYGSNSDTGKSTFIRILTGLMGDYATSVGVDTFMEKAFKKEYDLADLPGHRLVTTTEPQPGRRWDEERVKAITGGDAIQGRYPAGRWVTFFPQCKILMAGNHEPKIANVDDAMLRRIKILPFNVKVPKEKQIGDLDVKLIQREGGQILAWMIEGAQKYMDSGLSEPQALLDATQQYELEQDALATWLTEMCEVDEDASESGQTLFASWKQWCHENLEEPGTKNDFVARLRVKGDDFGFEESKHCGPNRTQRGFKFIRLRTLFDEDIA